jgi:teichuronic acid exporter
MPNQITKSFLWDFGGKIGNQLISFAIGIILARLLSPQDYGLIGMSMVFISLTGVFTNLGLSSALIQRKEPTEAHYSSSFYLNVFSAVILFLLFFILAPYIANYFNESKITSLVRVLSLTLIINSLTVVQDVRYRKKMLFKVLTQARISSMIVSGTVGLSMAFYGYGVWSLVFQNLIGGVVTSIILWYYSDWRPKLLFQWEALKDLWNYGFKMFLSGLLDTFYSQLSTLAIAKLFSAKELGLFTRANSLNRFVIKYSSESVGAVTFPAMANLQHNLKELVNLGKKAEITVAFVSFGLLGLLYVTSEPLILFLLGEKWRESIDIYKILSLSGFAYPISAASLNFIKAVGKSDSFLKVEVWKKIVGVMGLIIGFYFGLNGYLYSLIVTGFIAVGLNMYYVSTAVPLSVTQQVKGIAPYLILSVITSLIVMLIPIHFEKHFINLIIISTIYILIYLLLNLAFKTLGLTYTLIQSKKILKLKK